MAGRQPHRKLTDELLDIITRHSDGIGLADIEAALSEPVGRRTVQYRLGVLVREGRVRRDGERRWTLYLPVGGRPRAIPEEVPLSSAGRAVLERLDMPVAKRVATRYRPDSARRYRPGRTFRLPAKVRRHLHALGDVVGEPQPAGTYARRIADRLLIDLSWNSSRLEGNTYSLLDTRRLLALGVEADGHDPFEAQMIRNHRDAIEFLIDNVDATGFDRRTVLNLHALLANDLLPDPLSAGRLRRIPVAIGGSTYAPPDAPQTIESDFDALLATLRAIDDPFEQSFFALVQLPYLQPFDDVNKRVSRLAANIPMIRRNLVPISFVDVPVDLYAKAMLGVYELNDHALLRDLFLWAYERSVEHYREVRQEIGTPDPFRVRYRERLVDVVGEAVRRRVPRRELAAFVRARAEASVDEADRKRFREMAELELINLHEGNFARFRLRPSEFDAWRAARVDEP